MIDTPEKSDAFLWDWRRTIMQLLKANLYEQLTGMLHDIGMIRYGEAHEAEFATMGDGMEMKQSADVPMGAMWQDDRNPVPLRPFTSPILLSRRLWRTFMARTSPPVSP